MSWLVFVESVPIILNQASRAVWPKLLFLFYVVGLGGVFRTTRHWSTRLLRASGTDRRLDLLLLLGRRNDGGHPQAIHPEFTASSLCVW